MHPLVCRQRVRRDVGPDGRELRPQDRNVVGQFQSIDEARLRAQAGLVTEQVSGKPRVEQLHVTLDCPILTDQVFTHTGRHRTAPRLRLGIGNDDSVRVRDQRRFRMERIAGMDGARSQYINFLKVGISVTIGILPAVHAQAGRGQSTAQCLGPADAQPRARTHQRGVRCVGGIPPPLVSRIRPVIILVRIGFVAGAVDEREGRRSQPVRADIFVPVHNPVAIRISKGSIVPI